MPKLAGRPWFLELATWDRELLAKLDELRGDTSRHEWLKRTVEQASAGRGSPSTSAGQSVPAERHVRQPGPDVTRARSSAQVKANVRPIPKTPPAPSKKGR